MDVVFKKDKNNKNNSFLDFMKRLWQKIKGFKLSSNFYYFLLLIVLLLITTQIKKLMFLCHDRVKEFGLHRWGEGREKPVMEMCFALDSPLLAIWLTFFF